jgi:L-ascorbate metabolism protein UlaG (beta-lactamase superfamily)
MRITKFGHACLLIEDGSARLLIDPGTFSSGFEDLEGLDAILITHQHQDHCLPENIKALVDRNKDTVVYADEGSAGILSEHGVAVRAVHEGESWEVAGVSVAAVGRDHAVIHPDIPGIPNVGYLIADRFFYPGDAYTNPGRPVEVLAVPAGAPWLKIAEAVDYVRQVKPKVAIPVHDAVLAMPDMPASIMKRLTDGRGIEIRVVANSQSTEV